MMNLLTNTGNYLSLVKFSHTVFAMPFALVGFFLASITDGYGFSFKTFLLVVICMVLARSAAMSFNRLTDYRFDRMNPRTASREIPSGIISRKNALVFVVASSVLFIITTAFINNLTLLLSVPALAIVLGYSYTKRFTPLCHLILGLGLSLAPIGAYISVTGHFAFLPLVYSAIVITWVSGFDIIYALQDDEFDRSAGLFSLPAVLTRYKALSISVVLHVMTALLVFAAGYLGEAGMLYWIGTVLFLILLVYQHIIVKPDDLSRVTLAFGTMNGMAGLLFGLFVILDILI
ncbi:MAG TPA: UbiA-like polyprenyltransferase [Bacteroidales bacterium]|nr:UbiA-like polyprenyltransferase [Bacteroidales bacterium]